MDDIPVLIITDVISFNIPLLLSKESMKRANTIIDFKNDYVELFGKMINLFFTSSGHYCIPIKNVTNNLGAFNDVNNVLNSNCTSDKNEKKNKALKLHHQFGHQNYKKIVDLLKDAEVNDKESEEELKKVNDSCEICLRYKNSRPRPIVGFSMAKSFNEAVGMTKSFNEAVRMAKSFNEAVGMAKSFNEAVRIAKSFNEAVQMAKSFNESAWMDLKQWSSNPHVWFLHLIDHAASKVALASFTPRKRRK